MFETHKLTAAGFADVVVLKTKMAEAVSSVMTLMPEGRDKAVFKTKLEEAVFFGTKAVASKPGNYTEIQHYGPTT